jgi:hypothetical protein
MDEENIKEEKITSVVTKQKIGLGVKILLTAIVVGAVAAGVYVAVAFSQ